MSALLWCLMSGFLHKSNFPMGVWVSSYAHSIVYNISYDSFCSVSQT